jgi:hypothetical protein
VAEVEKPKTIDGETRAAKQESAVVVLKKVN